MYMYMTVTEIFYFFIVPQIKTTDVNRQTSMSTVLPEISSKASTTSSPGTDTSIFVNMTKLTEQGTITTAIDVTTSLSTTHLTSSVTLRVSSTASPKISVTKEKVSGTITTYINKSSTEREQTIYFVGSATASPGNKSSVPVTMNQVIVITVLGAVITVAVVIGTLILFKRKRKRKQYKRKSECTGMRNYAEGQELMQTSRCNNRSHIDAKPSNRQHTQGFEIISVNDYQEPVDMDNQYQRLDFTMRNEVEPTAEKEHKIYSLSYDKLTRSPPVINSGLKCPTKAGNSLKTKERTEYCIPCDALTHPPAVNKDSTKRPGIAGTLVMSTDVQHGQVAAYCDTAIVHEDFLYDIPRPSISK
ncbi:uncharacterized protein [Mytilus edulis]|uniref:uncharacterized protein n=1 Tax=Mytilus edulis TaxID=6550 RepID=UPI0039F072C1